MARDVKIMGERDEDSQHNFNMFLFNELPQKLWQFRLGLLSNMSHIVLPICVNSVLI